MLLAVGTATLVTLGSSTSASAQEIDAQTQEVITAELAEYAGTVEEPLEEIEPLADIRGPYLFGVCHAHGVAGLASGAWSWYACVPVAGVPILYFLITN